MKCKNFTSCLHLPCDMLTLDQSTLLYWTLSDLNVKKQEHGCTINDWAVAISSNAKPASCAASQASCAPNQTTMATCKSNSICSGSILPLSSLTNGTSVLSVLTNNIKIVSHMALEPGKVKAEPINTGVDGNASLSDNDETKGNK